MPLKSDGNLFNSINMFNYDKLESEFFNQSVSNNVNEARPRRNIKPPADKSLVQGKWVYKKKLNEKGEVVRYKARWVAKGYVYL